MNVFMFKAFKKKSKLLERILKFTTVQCSMVQVVEDLWTWGLRAPKAYRCTWAVKDGLIKPDLHKLVNYCGLWSTAVRSQARDAPLQMVRVHADSCPLPTWAIETIKPWKRLPYCNRGHLRSPASVHSRSDFPSSAQQVVLILWLTDAHDNAHIYCSCPCSRLRRYQCITEASYWAKRHLFMVLQTNNISQKRNVSHFIH